MLKNIIKKKNKKKPNALLPRHSHHTSQVQYCTYSGEILKTLYLEEFFVCKGTFGDKLNEKHRNSREYTISKAASGGRATHVAEPVALLARFDT